MKPDIARREMTLGFCRLATQLLGSRWLNPAGLPWMSRQALTTIRLAMGMVIINSPTPSTGICIRIWLIILITNSRASNANGCLRKIWKASFSHCQPDEAGSVAAIMVVTVAAVPVVEHGASGYAQSALDRAA